MATQNESPPLLRKSYLVVLGLALVVMLVLNPSVVRGLFRTGGARKNVPHAPRVGAGALHEREDLTSIRRDVAVFSDWLQGAPGAEIVIQRESVVVLTPPTHVRALWPVPVSGTSLSVDGNWIAAVGCSVLKTGDVIGPSAALCGYQVLNITRRCVWLAAFYTDQPTDGLPTLKWPDIEGVHTSLVKSEPNWVELRRGVAVHPRDALVFPSTGARMVLDRLWPNVVHFRYEPSDGGDHIDLMCVIVR
jgi:hypothetical protein